ncbi:hypothetical protein LIER_03264 [Lithospermum erythrorhizon]|uniref:Uncharacterized protein n=1 Tax=Lithospermum erythrorhizon TaxID=34254 RepID=A0AAV3NSI8_LITER
MGPEEDKVTTLVAHTDCTKVVLLNGLCFAHLLRRGVVAALLYITVMLWKIGIQSMSEVVEVSFLVSSQDRTELVDTGESPECLPIEVAESSPPVLPTLTIAQGAEAILRT